MPSTSKILILGGMWMKSPSPKNKFQVSPHMLFGPEAETVCVTDGSYSEPICRAQNNFKEAH